MKDQFLELIVEPAVRITVYAYCAFVIAAPWLMCYVVYKLAVKS